MIKAPRVPEKPGWRDYYQMVTTGLMMGLGVYILWQTFFIKWAIPSFIFGVAILLFGLFRVRIIYDYFKHRGKRHGG